MSVSSTFNIASADARVSAGRRRKRRPSPFSLRLTEAERARLAVEAAGAPLGTYIKAKVLGEARPSRMSRTGLPVRDKRALGQALALRGRSRLASNLNQLAFAANIGALDLNHATASRLAEALDDVRAIRLMLLTALGLKAETAP